MLEQGPINIGQDKRVKILEKNVNSKEKIELNKTFFDKLSQLQKLLPEVFLHLLCSFDLQMLLYGIKGGIDLMIPDNLFSPEELSKLKLALESVDLVLIKGQHQTGQQLYLIYDPKIVRRDINKYATQPNPILSEDIRAE